MTSERIPFKAAIGAAALLLLDVFALNQAVLPLLAGTLMVLFQGPAAVLAARRGETGLAVLRGLRAVFFVAAAGLAVAGVRINNDIAQGRAERIVFACGRFNQAKGRFPQDLQELVPEFLPAVPRAKPVALFSDFRYDAVAGRHRLSWRVFPPKGWRFVFVEDGSGGTEGLRER